MKHSISIDIASKTPVYKQLINSVLELIQNGHLKEGDMLLSMNELSQSLEVSKETVKKAYTILREKGIVESAQGKGFYISGTTESKTRVLMLFDKLSTYKFVLYRSFIENTGDSVNVTIHLHEQDPELFENLLNENLDQFDYYIITPHFALDRATQNRIIRLLKRIPNRKLILLDRYIEGLTGNFGAVFQRFEEDVQTGLDQALPFVSKYNAIHVISASSSLYGPIIKNGVSKFCEAHKLSYEFFDYKPTIEIETGIAYLVLNGQLDIELIDIIRSAKTQHLKIGDEIGIISYNESPLNEIILDGLTVLSTDFKEMGRRTAEMVKTGKLVKMANPFGLIVRQTL